MLRSNVRVGIMRIPKSNFRNDIEESLYLFGNFAIPNGQDIPDSAKSAEALYCLFTPAEGEEKMTEEAKYIRAALSSNAEKLHWARFQDIPVVYHDKAKKVLLLGDASHSFCPSLGQGATLAIEDACIASHLLLSSIRKSEPLSIAIDKIAEHQTERVSMIRDMSNEAAKHILFETGEPNGSSALIQDSDAWTNEKSISQWRDKVRQMWLSYPKIPNQEHNTWLQRILKENSVDQYHPEFDKFLSSHSVSTVIAIEQLGGNKKHVQQFLARYTTKLEPNSLTTGQQYTDASAFNLSDLLGKRQHYYRVLKLYQEKLENLEGDVYALLQTSFPLLSAGIAGSLFHAGINLGYAVSSRSQTIIVEQLAYLHYTHNPLIYTKPRAENHIQFFGQGEHSLLEVLSLLRKDRNKFITLQKTAELKMGTQKDGWFSSTPQYRIAAMVGARQYALRLRAQNTHPRFI